MNRFLLIMSIFTASLFSNFASAEGYWGAKISSIDIDVNNYTNTTNVGIFVGAEFGQLGSNIVSLEGEITTSIIDGDTNVGGVDWEVQTLAIYAAMRTGTDNYIKVKAGILDREITLSPSGATGSDEGLSWGIGFGFSNYEIEYTFFDGDGNTDSSMISLGYLF